MILRFSFFARSDERSEVPAPVSKINSNGPSPFTCTGRRISGCASPAKRNLTFALLGESVAVVILPVSVRLCATILTHCQLRIAQARESALHRNLRRNGDRCLCKPRSSESRKAEDQRIA